MNDDHYHDDNGNHIKQLQIDRIVEWRCGIIDNSQKESKRERESTNQTKDHRFIDCNLQIHIQDLCVCCALNKCYRFVILSIWRVYTTMWPFQQDSRCMRALLNLALRKRLLFFSWFFSLLFRFFILNSSLCFIFLFTSSFIHFHISKSKALMICFCISSRKLNISNSNSNGGKIIKVICSFDYVVVVVV